MKTISAGEFFREFPRRKQFAQIVAAERDVIVIAEDTRLEGIPGQVIVKNGIYAELSCLISEKLTVEQNAIVYFSGLIDGEVSLDGALCVLGHISGRLTAAKDAVIAQASNDSCNGESSDAEES
jgi:hypothetical protein